MEVNLVVYVYILCLKRSREHAVLKIHSILSRECVCVRAFASNNQEKYVIAYTCKRVKGWNKILPGSIKHVKLVKLSQMQKKCLYNLLLISIFFYFRKNQ